MSDDRLERALRLLRLSDLEDALRYTIGSESARAIEVAEQVRGLDAAGFADAVAAASPGVGISAVPPRYEMAILWAPADVPVTVHAYINGVRVPGAHGTFRGGLAFFPVPREMVPDGDGGVVLALRFWQGGWRYQFHTRDGDDRRLVDQGRDARPADPADDRLIKTFRFRGDS